MSEQLKPCPFCGGSDCYTVDDYGDVGVACIYRNQGDNWNTRPVEDALQDRLTHVININIEMFEEMRKLRLRIVELERLLKWAQYDIESWKMDDEPDIKDIDPSYWCELVNEILLPPEERK